MRPLALLNDLVDADRGELADALRPLYIDYLEKHGSGDESDAGDAVVEPGLGDEGDD
jgi:hypothetical protein